MKGLTILAVAACLTIVVVVLQIKKIPEFKNVPDASHYIAMAEGHSEKVILPYARRILLPWVIGKLRPSVGTDFSFLIIGTFSLLIFLFVVLWILNYEIKQSFVISTVLILIPCLFLLYYNLYRPNLLFNALSSIYWILLIRKRYVISLLILFFLFLTREEAVLISLSFISGILVSILTKPNKKTPYYFYISFTIIIACLGYVITNYAAKNSTNMQHLPTLFYWLFKFACFVMRSLTGLSHWVDTYRILPFYSHLPLIVFDSPEWLRRISDIKQFGIYEWNIMGILMQLLSALALFGTAPTILLYFIKKNSLKVIIKNGSLAFNTILLYGITMFILAPFTGNDLFRFYFNAWPAFFLIVPFFLKWINQYDKKIFVKVILCYILSAWLFVVSFYVKDSLGILALIVIEIILHRYTWRMLSLFSKTPLPLETISYKFYK